MGLSSGRYQSFVVRIWTRKTGAPLVHGRITHVGTRESRTFRTTEDMVRFMLNRVKTPDEPAEQEPSS